MLPWREDPSPYRVWISEIMLQQTQVVTVVPYFEKFVGRFPNVEALAHATTDEVMLHWAGLGYYSRARNIHKAAQQVVQQGGFPQSRDAWLELPGVGPYTAGAISSIAFDQVEAILDGNVERVLSRLHCLSREKGDAAYKGELWKLSGEAVQSAAQQSVRPRVFNQALMELGATVCTPKKPKCGVCPVADVCLAKQSERIDAFPPPKAKKAWLEVRETCLAIYDIRGEHVLMRKREANEWRAGLWDLPEVEQIPKAWLKNLRTEELGTMESKHVVTRHKIQRQTRVARLAALKGRQQPELPLPGSNWAWVKWRQPDAALGSAPQKVLKLIQERYF